MFAAQTMDGANTRVEIMSCLSIIVVEVGGLSSKRLLVVLSTEYIEG